MFNYDTQIVDEMLGYQPLIERAFKAAAFLAGKFGEVPSQESIQRAIIEFGEDFEQAALRAYGLEPNEANIQSLRGIMGFQKSEPANDYTKTRQTIKVPLDKVHLKFLGKLGGYNVFLVDGNFVRNYIYIDYTSGGNPARYNFIPSNEIWVGGENQQDMMANLLHEFVECKRMCGGESYDDAHDFAAAVEQQFRKYSTQSPTLDDVAQTATLLGDLHKSELEANIVPLTEDAGEVADEVKKAFLQGNVQEVQLKGKHSKGTLICQEAKTTHTYLLKPGSGGFSPACGVTDELASQSKRECAFWKIADMVGLDEFYPRADLLAVNGKEMACLHLLPYDFHTLDSYYKEDPNFPTKILEKYRKNGTLHKWAILDYILGQTDRHSNNIMANSEGKVALIDQGSSFAGKSFSPAYDKNTFIPFYLRASIRTQDFNRMDTDEKLRNMPRVSVDVEKLLKRWLNDINEESISMVLNEYGINKSPTIDRLQKVKLEASQNFTDYVINRLWITS